MPDPRLGRALSALLPERIVADAFEPAFEDLRLAYLVRRQDSGSSLGRAALYGAFVALAILLFLDCWRLVVAGVFHRRECAVDRPLPHDVITEPKQTERFP